MPNTPVVEVCSYCNQPKEVCSCPKDLNSDAVLKQLRKEAERIRLGDMTPETVMSMVDNFRDLDDWLSQQGAPPMDWFFPPEE